MFSITHNQHTEGILSNLISTLLTVNNHRFRFHFHRSVVSVRPCRWRGQQVVCRWFVVSIWQNMVNRLDLMVEIYDGKKFLNIQANQACFQLVGICYCCKPSLTAWLDYRDGDWSNRRLPFYFLPRTCRKRPSGVRMYIFRSSNWRIRFSGNWLVESLISGPVANPCCSSGRVYPPA